MFLVSYGKRRDVLDGGANFKQADIKMFEPRFLPYADGLVHCSYSAFDSFRQQPSLLSKAPAQKTTRSIKRGDALI